VISRRKLLLSGTGMAALGAAYPVLVEPRWFEITRTRVV